MSAPDENIPHLRAPEGIRGFLTALAVVIGPALLGAVAIWAVMRYGTHPVVVTP